MSIPSEARQQHYKHKVIYCTTMGKVYKGALIVLLLIIVGLLLKISFLDSATIVNIDVAAQLSRLRAHAARNEDLMMRLYESLEMQSQEIVRPTEKDDAAGLMLARKINKIEELVREHNQRALYELKIIKTKVADHHSFFKSLAQSLEAFQNSMSKLLSPLKDIGKWF